MLKNCTPLWRKAHSEVKMYKTPHSESTFVSADVEKLHAAVVKRAFASENIKKLRVREHFLKFRCRKKCTPLWRNVHFEANMYKTRQFRTTFQTSDAPKLGAAAAKSNF